VRHTREIAPALMCLAMTIESTFRNDIKTVRAVPNLKWKYPYALRCDASIGTRSVQQVENCPKINVTRGKRLYHLRSKSAPKIGSLLKEIRKSTAFE